MKPASLALAGLAPVLFLSACGGGGGGALVDSGVLGNASDGASSTMDLASAAAGGNSVSYSAADKVEKTISGGARAQVAASASNSSLSIVLSDGNTPDCDDHTTAVDKAWLELSVFRAGSNTPIQAGTYLFSGASGDAHAEGYLREFAAGCSQKDVLRNGGTYTGTLTLSSVTATSVEGTFDFDGQSVTPAGMGHASGSFTATLCAAAHEPSCMQ